MKNNLVILATAILFLFSCNEIPVKKIQISPLDQLSHVNQLLSHIAEKPQKLIAPSDKESTVTGKKGTIIHVNPEKLETVDGEAVSGPIEIELLEMTNKSSLLLHNAQTISDGKILVSGGAYYVNMTAGNKQLKIKDNEELNVEFPKMTEQDMLLFRGERDSLGEMNWKPTTQRFSAKELVDPIKPSKPRKKTKKLDLSDVSLVIERTYINEEDSLVPPKKVNKEDVSEREYKKYLRRMALYEKLKKQIDYLRNTYEPVALSNFGWINCDKFYADSRPMARIKLTIENDLFQGVKIYGVFKNLNSFLGKNYWKGQTEDLYFSRIPVGEEFHIIAIATKDELPYLFERKIDTQVESEVSIELKASTQAEIETKLSLIN